MLDTILSHHGWYTCTMVRVTNAFQMQAIMAVTACVNLMHVGRPAVMVSAILAARHA